MSTRWKEHGGRHYLLGGMSGGRTLGTVHQESDGWWAMVDDDEVSWEVACRPTLAEAKAAVEEAVETRGSAE